MSKRTLPGIQAITPRAHMSWEVMPQALERWDPGLRAAATSEDPQSISILEVIGQDFWTGEGVTAKRISGALRNIGAKNPVTVNINSPGGDYFEGLAIYNLLREHQGEVTVKVMGLAASAASVIAMAGDRIEIARAGFLMIHNTITGVWGNRNDMRDVADTLEPIDAALADLYAVRTGNDLKDMAKLMDKESWIGGSQAVDQGFADSLLAADAVGHGQDTTTARAYRVEQALAKAGYSRSERRKLISDLVDDFKSGMPGAAGSGTPGAADQDTPGAVSLDLSFVSNYL